ncbi:Uncharacterised protein [Burkholderia pseudomallei]|nr:Uncharacterised protein [Burkholderia pseudomallei]CAJ5197051.1 Uncharacterised protein [Burkholderia pseudomallei]CAJ7204025.1 Uncharacterised protein [Burkholderia pseudomallei]CAK0030303.1 Uncharacterised protein [Burkholderia pseudomallei]VBP67980.1 Uncharacterised protein [Burkholderia pseudomallei]
MPLVIAAERARMVMMSGAPLCSTSFTTKLPLSTSGSPAHPIDALIVAPRFGMSRSFFESSSTISMVSASSERDSEIDSDTSRGANRRDRSRPPTEMR